MDRMKAIRTRIEPKLYDSTYMLTKSNIEIFDELINNFENANSLKVLDVGCGYKPYKILLSKKFSQLEYVGVDFSTENAEPDIILDMNKDKLPFDDNYFDLVILSEVLEHLYNPMHCLKEVIRCLKVEGYMYVSTPFLFGNHDPQHDYYRFTDLFYKRFASENDLEIVKIKKSGSIVSSPFFIINLLLHGLISRKRLFLLYPIVVINNVLGSLTDQFINRLGNRIPFVREGKEYLYFGLAVIFRKIAK